MAADGQQVDLAGKYTSQHAQALELVTALVSAKFGGQGPDDPRRAFLVELEMGRLTARVELNAMALLLQEVLGILKEDEVPGTTLVATINEEMALELERLEEEVADLIGTPGRD